MLKYFHIESIKIACWIYGSVFDKEKPSLLFIHGSGSDHSAWSCQYARLHKQNNIFAIDLPGHGRSGGNGEADVEAYCLWVKKLIDILDLKRVISCRPFVRRGYRASIRSKLSAGNCGNCFGWRRHKNAG